MPKGHSESNKPKCDLVQLDMLHSEGKSQRELAEIFNVSQATISRSLNKGKVAIVNTAAIEKTSHIVAAHLDMAGQLRKVNETINNEMDRLQGLAQTVDDPADVARLQDTIIKMAAEIRKQLQTQVQIFEAWKDWEYWEDWKNKVLDVLDGFEPGVKVQAINEMKAKGLLRSSIDIR